MIANLSSKLVSFMSLVIFLFLCHLLGAVDDLGTWTEVDCGLSTTQNYDIYGMAHGNNYFVMVGQDVEAGVAFTANSPDGEKWTLRSAGSSSELYHSVICSGTRFIAVCKQPDKGNARIWISDDNGNKWKAVNSDNEGLIVNGGLSSHRMTEYWRNALRSG